MTNRTRAEIVSQILQATNDDEDVNNGEGITLTKLMYKVILCNEQMKEYLALLIEDGLISYDSTMRTFKTTEKGRAFLQSYIKIDQILKEHEI